MDGTVTVSGDGARVTLWLRDGVSVTRLVHLDEAPTDAAKKMLTVMAEHVGQALKNAIEKR